MRKDIPEQKIPGKLDKNAKSSLRIMFLTLFLDLVGFSIIFPLFPAMAEYYLANDSGDPTLQAVFSLISGFTSLGNTDVSTIVLFGGLLGALYSLLQFIATPFWGGLSDKIGRRPVLLISTSGILLSYILWFFSGSFTLLIISRVIGGVMGGNISVATAVASDVTSEQNRSKAMAFVGIAFALGFLIGPAIGGASYLWDMGQLEIWGVHPFSFAALIAGVLAFINLIFIATKFKETNTEVSTASVGRTANIFKLFSFKSTPGIKSICLSYFMFILVFSGMEFTLTFLALERFGYTPLDNAYMFIFIGVVLALVQGGYVRRAAFKVGEKRMALRGMGIIFPGLLFCAFAQSEIFLFIGLLLLAMGSALVIPTMTSLVSMRSLKSVQGLALGRFRSLGALGRVVGPIISSLIYWKYGGQLSFICGAMLVFVPLAILKVEEPTVEQKVNP